MSDCLIVIPARYGSTRLPAKMLARLEGRTILEWCWRAARAARLGPVLIATDDGRIRREASGFGAQTIMTPSSCPSGTDRVHRAARGRRERRIINLQGDQPLVRAATLRRVAALLAREPDADIATAVAPLADARLARDPNVVKSVVTDGGRALYFSRSPVPFAKAGRPAYLHHVGIYGFRRAALDRFVALPPSALERAESLEQLRALEAGMAIYAVRVDDPALSIDTPEDLSRAARLARRRGLRPYAAPRSRT